MSTYSGPKLPGSRGRLDRSGTMTAWKRRCSEDRHAAARRCYPCPTSPIFIGSGSNIHTWPSSCFGKSTGRQTRAATSTAASASCISGGGGNRMWCCGRSTGPARSCSWIGPEQPYRSMIRVVAQCSRRISSSPCWEPVLTPTPKPLPTSSWQVGSAHTYGPSSFIRVCRNSWYRTTPRPA